MAKWGEGDARWQVADRADGRNCGSWHWEESDQTDAFREELRSRTARGEGFAPGITIGAFRFERVIANEGCLVKVNQRFRRATD